MNSEWSFLYSTILCGMWLCSESLRHDEHWIQQKPGHVTLEIQVLDLDGNTHYFVDISDIVDHHSLHKASECQHKLEELCLNFSLLLS